MLLGLLGKEHNDPPAFPEGKPNMSFIDSPLAPPGCDSKEINGRYICYRASTFAIEL
jgi:hypothetical protein